MLKDFLKTSLFSFLISPLENELIFYRLGLAELGAGNERLSDGNYSPIIISSKNQVFQTVSEKEKKIKQPVEKIAKVQVNHNQ